MLIGALDRSYCVFRLRVLDSVLLSRAPSSSSPAPMLRSARGEGPHRGDKAPLLPAVPAVPGENPMSGVSLCRDNCTDACHYAETIAPRPRTGRFPPLLPPPHPPAPCPVARALASSAASLTHHARSPLPSPSAVPRATPVRNLVLIMLTAALAVFLPKVDVVFGFLGGTTVVFVVFIFPAAMKLRIQDPPPTLVERGMCAAMLLFGLFLLGSTVYRMLR